jgi:hypothetical protein
MRLRALGGLALVLAICACGDSAAPPPPPPPPPPTPQQIGQWSPLRPAPIVQLHLHLLTTGKVLTWGHYGDPQIWDPSTGAFTAVPSPVLVFCAGHDWLPDGRLLVAGGHISDVHGLAATNVFDPRTETWQAVASMAAGRWYPTNTTLPNGEVLTLSGTDENAVTVPVPEIWNGSSWRQLTTASLALPLYPRVFVAPDGRVFYAGEGQQSLYLDVAGTGQWTNGPLRKYGTRDYGSAVMYEPGKILYVGGGDPPTNTAEVIDLNQPNPVWQWTGSMLYARRQMDATLLPTGDVLVTGGTTSGGFSNPAGGVRRAEIWHPATGVWSPVASAAVTRIYHGATLLLPDARVLFTGSGDAAGAKDEKNYEVYSPPYLFLGERPEITGSLPGKVLYGQTLTVGTRGGGVATIAKVTLLRFSSVTHAFDQAARLVPLTFSPSGRSVTVTFPSGPTIAPPGPYMLFLVNDAGVPSAARILLLN